MRDDELHRRLGFLYGARGPEVADRVRELVNVYRSRRRQPDRSQRWDARDIALITYADQIRSPHGPPLESLHAFLIQAELKGKLNTIHLLPFFPYSSDDGFSVIDYRRVHEEMGDWKDVSRLAADFRLMFDLVLNHVSTQSHYFQKYLSGDPPFDRFFIEVDPSTDLSTVVRPRSTPLLTPVETSRGVRYVWTTFGADQVDLNYHEPDVLLEILDILLFYVEHGARTVRLDAIAFLWKEIGTPCIHLPQTHEVVKLMRQLLEEAAPDVLILTETNVPHEENISYFGDGDEAHMVYQFSLPPLLLDAFLHQDATIIAKWLNDLKPPPTGCTFFNFTASHDGVGVRPLEGLAPPDRIESLVNHVRVRGGLVSMRATPDGGEAPYELNITYVDAIRDEKDTPEQHARRFLATQAIMLALQGVPGVYFHSLVGSRNDYDGVERSGIARRINRHKYQWQELHQSLSTDPLQRAIYEGYQRLLTVRREQAAFHPDAAQRPLRLNNPSLFGFLRGNIKPAQQILVLTNVSRSACKVDLSSLDPSATFRRDLITGDTFEGTTQVLPPDTTVWLVE